MAILEIRWKNCCFEAASRRIPYSFRVEPKAARRKRTKERKRVSGQEYLPRVAFVLAVGSLLEFILENGVSCYLRKTFAHRFTNWNLGFSREDLVESESLTAKTRESMENRKLGSIVILRFPISIWQNWIYSDAKNIDRQLGIFLKKLNSLRLKVSIFLFYVRLREKKKYLF